MYKLSDLPEIVRHAYTSWRSINGRAVDPDELRAGMLYMSGDHRGNFTDRVCHLIFDLEDSDILTNQPALPGLIRKWRPRFEPSLNLSEQEALYFLVEAGSALELLEQVFAEHSLSGVTIMEEGAPNDAEIRRPAREHAGWSLNLSVSGTGHYNCVRQEILTTPGDLILLSPDAMYDCRRARQASHWTHSWIYFQPDQRLLDWLNWPEIGPHIYQLRLPDSEFPIIKSLFDSTLDFDPTENRLSAALLLNITEQILIRCSLFSTCPSRRTTDIRVKNAMEYISSNLDCRLSVQDIAQYVQLSRAQLSALFKEHTGCTIINWREERRVAKASQLLSQTSLQIQEIAEQVGYEDPLYFSRTFSRLVGCSPRSYRKDHVRIMENYLRDGP